MQCRLRYIKLKCFKYAWLDKLFPCNKGTYMPVIGSASARTKLKNFLKIKNKVQYFEWEQALVRIYILYLTKHRWLCEMILMYYYCLTNQQMLSWISSLGAIRQKIIWALISIRCLITCFKHNTANLKRFTLFVIV